MRRGGHRGAGISAQLLGVPLITKRLVFQVGGYDPMSPEAAYRRFNRELRRFETTWGATARTTEAEVTPDEVRWRVATRGPDWAVETVYHLVRWDDVIESDWKRSDWQRIPSGLLAFADFLWNGAFLGYLRSNWRYAGFFLYPYVGVRFLAAVRASHAVDHEARADARGADQVNLGGPGLFLRPVLRADADVL